MRNPPAGRFEIFVHGRPAQVDRLDGGGKSKSDMHDVSAGGKHKCRRRRLVFLHQLEISIRVGLGAIDAPGQAAADWQRVLAEARTERQRHLPRRDHGNRGGRVGRVRRLLRLRRRHRGDRQIARSENIAARGRDRRNQAGRWRRRKQRILRRGCLRRDCESGETQGPAIAGRARRRLRMPWS